MLEVREAPDPDPGPGEVRVRVRAAGLNFAEIMGRLGLYPDAPKPPCVLGYEAAGIVDAIGEGVTAPTVGARVVALSRFGAHADTLCVPAAQVVELPGAMGFEEAAALPVNYITAYHALFRVAALQLCRTVAGVVTFGTSSRAKHDAIRAEGCTHPLDYRAVDYESEVRRIEPAGVDVVLDPLGGNDWRKGYRLLRPAGRLVVYGFANLASGERRSYLHAAVQLARTPIFTPLGLMNENKAVAGVNIGHLWGEMPLLREAMEALVRLYRDGQIRPHVDQAFPFERAAEAHRRMQGRQNVGKILLVP